MNKFIIRTNEPDSKIGYCMSDLNTIDCLLDELLNIKFKTTSYTRTLDYDVVKDLEIKETHPEYKIVLYQKPKNYLNSLDWYSVNLESLKKMKTFKEIEYNGHKIYIGLDITEDSLNKMSNSEVYKTFYSGNLTTNCRMSIDKFKI